MAESATRETSETRETTTIVPVTGAIYSNGQEKPSSRWSFEIGLNLTEDKFLSTVLKRLEKGYGIKDKCAALNITKFKLQASAKDFTPILPEWPKGRIFCIDSQEQWEIPFLRYMDIKENLLVSNFLISVPCLYAMHGHASDYINSLTLSMVTTFKQVKFVDLKQFS